MEVLLLIPQLMLFTSKPRAEDKAVLCCLPSSVTATEGGRHGGGFRLEDKSVQVIYSRSEPDS